MIEPGRPYPPELGMQMNRCFEIRDLELLRPITSPSTRYGLSPVLGTGPDCPFRSESCFAVGLQFYLLLLDPSLSSYANSQPHSISISIAYINKGRSTCGQRAVLLAICGCMATALFKCACVCLFSGSKPSRSIGKVPL